MMGLISGVEEARLDAGNTPFNPKGDASQSWVTCQVSCMPRGVECPKVWRFDLESLRVE